tara:strand:- start:609 stop:728 length:120 start_codon:yes stop_codon:yes gene_type:complete
MATIIGCFAVYEGEAVCGVLLDEVVNDVFAAVVSGKGSH